MLVAGVTLSAGAVAVLAGRMDKAGYTDLAMRIGLAVDANREEVALSRAEQRQVVGVLGPSANGLRELRDALRGR